jgi:1,4-alpha-glucan branching enzyme
MGCEFGQRGEWNHDQVLDWKLLELPAHDGIRHWVQDLHRLYRTELSMAELDSSPDGFRWVDGSDAERSVLSFLRCGRSPASEILVVANFTPVPRHNYRVGVPTSGPWKELLNSDSPHYGGSGMGNVGGMDASPIPSHGSMWSLNLTLPPLAIMFWKSAGNDGRTA